MVACKTLTKWGKCYGLRDDVHFVGNRMQFYDDLEIVDSLVRPDSQGDIQVCIVNHSTDSRRMASGMSLGIVEPLVKLGGKQKSFYHVYEVVAETSSCVLRPHDRQGKATVYINHKFPLVDEGKLLEGKKAGQRSEYLLVCDRTVPPGSGSEASPVNFYDDLGRLEDSVSVDGVLFTGKPTEAHGIELEVPQNILNPPET